jgi:hypothetical protein
MDLGGLRDITVRAGEDFSIHVPYVAFPKPTASWFCNDSILDDTDSRIFQKVQMIPSVICSTCKLWSNILILQERAKLSQFILCFQLTDDSASFVVKNSKRSDSGQYRLQLRNQHGFDTATVNVRVLDRPGPPENLRADEFAGEALTLFWNPPKDNGGADITNYVVEKREPRSPTWSKVFNSLTIADTH